MTSKPILVDDGIPTSSPFTGWDNYFSLSPTPDSGNPDSVSVTSKSKLKIDDYPAVTQVIITWTASSTVYNSTISGDCLTSVDGVGVIKEGDTGVGNGVATVKTGAGNSKWVTE